MSLSPGRTAALAADWDVIHDAGLDFALVRLADKPGDDRSEDGTRGFLRPAAHMFRRDEPLFIVQHPQGAPMAWTPGFVLNPEDGDRVTYNANTDEGSRHGPVGDGRPARTYRLYSV